MMSASCCDGNRAASDRCIGSQFGFGASSSLRGNARMEGADVQFCAPSCHRKQHDIQNDCKLLTMPSPSEEILCASKGILGSPGSDSLSLDSTRVGLFGTSAARFARELFRQTNFSKSCSSLHSRSPMCNEQVLFWSTFSGPKLVIELASTELAGSTLRFLPSWSC